MQHIAYGASAYGASAYGASAYGASAYGASAYGASAYGASAYGASAYGALPELVFCLFFEDGHLTSCVGALKGNIQHVC
jgi:hypothetical protein